MATTPKSNRVRVLDPSVAERIAAGEVIERPASVVKELVENSLDAGATEIAVVLEEGGKALIEVTDNGHGIAPEDLALCTERHATSKLQTLDDLEKIATLGFRGEALPSIAAVSDLTLISRARQPEHRQDVDATKYNDAHRFMIRSLNKDANTEPLTFGHFLGSPHGTRIQARGLFSQIPARLKFLKSQASEVAQVREWLERLALAHPATGFRLVSDDRTVLNLRPQDEIQRVKTLLGDSGDYPLISAQSDLGLGDGALHVRAHWIQGLSLAQTRKISQTVNGRSVRDRFLQQAVLNAFKQALLPGQFPAVALFVEIDPAELDVNVHPTKTEIRFLDGKRVFSAIGSVLGSMIEKRGAPAYVAPTNSTAPLTSTPVRPFSLVAPASLETARVMPLESSIPRNPLGLDPQRFRGIFFNTYLAYDAGTELILVDQHAAHERIRFEALKKRAIDSGQGGVQTLLIPEAIRFDAERRADVEARLEWFSRLGFEAEIFGEDTLLFRALPLEWGTHDLRTRLKGLIDRMLEVEIQPLSRILLDEKLFEKLASEACHSAFRAGDRLEPIEVHELIRQLFLCEHPWNCPHGRPTVARIPETKIEEWFQRRL